VRFVPPAPLPPRGFQLKIIWVLGFAAACIIVGVGIGLILANRLKRFPGGLSLSIGVDPAV
jgi:hypothetical protein